MEKDIEKSGLSIFPKDGDAAMGATEPIKASTFSSFVDSFKQNPNARMVTQDVDDDGKPVDVGYAEPAMSMSLKPRHLQMIAIGGSIGMLCLEKASACPGYLCSA